MQKSVDANNYLFGEHEREKSKYNKGKNNKKNAVDFSAENLKRLFHAVMLGNNFHVNFECRLVATNNEASTKHEISCQQKIYLGLYIYYIIMYRRV